LSNHRVDLPWCTQALAFIELPVDIVTSQGFNVSLAVHYFVRKLLSQKCRGSKKKNIFQLFGILNALSHSRAAHASHQAVTIKAGVLCACEQFPHFRILACID
jgi:hypothetical protein